MKLPYPNVERRPNEWGFNSCVTLDGAVAVAKWMSRRGSHWYIWRLADGTFTYSAVPEPTTPGFPAELVREIHA